MTETPEDRRGWLQTWMQGEAPIDPTKRPVVRNEEVYALLEHATSRGIAQEKVNGLSQVIHQSEPDPSEVASLYAGLVTETKPVNGRTVLESRSSLRRLSGIATVITTFFILAVGNYIADGWLADIVEPEEGRFWFDFKRYVWDYLTPFFWGGLGSCVFLMKKVQDLAAEEQYELHQFQGWGTRILIGGMFGALVLLIFDPSSVTAEALPLRSSAVAFLAGLGVKVVYGAFERTIEVLADKLGIAQIRTAGARPRRRKA